MSVMTTTTLGVGFKVEESDLIDFFGQEKFEEWGIELLDNYLIDYPLLSMVTGGNGMDGELDYVIAVQRLKRGFRSYGSPFYGVFGLDKPVLSLDERIQLLDVAAEILGREPQIGQFVAIYVG